MLHNNVGAKYLLCSVTLNRTHIIPSINVVENVRPCEKILIFLHCCWAVFQSYLTPIIQQQQYRRILLLYEGTPYHTACTAVGCYGWKAIPVQQQYISITYICEHCCNHNSANVDEGREGKRFCCRIVCMICTLLVAIHMCTAAASSSSTTIIQDTKNTHCCKVYIRMPQRKVEKEKKKEKKKKKKIQGVHPSLLRVTPPIISYVCILLSAALRIIPGATDCCCRARKCTERCLQTGVKNKWDDNTRTAMIYRCQLCCASCPWTWFFAHVIRMLHFWYINMYVHNTGMKWLVDD